MLKARCYYSKPLIRVFKNTCLQCSGVISRRSTGGPGSRVTLYDELGVHITASKTEIENAYFDLCQKYRPDADIEDHNRFIRINEAFKVLKDPSSRSMYNESLRAMLEDESGEGIMAKWNPYNISQSESLGNKPEDTRRDKFTHYEVLGVDVNATVDDLDYAYENLIEKYKPPSYENARITEAYSLLSQPTERRRYDETLIAQQTTGSIETQQTTDSIETQQNTDSIETQQNTDAQEFNNENVDHTKKFKLPDYYYDLQMQQDSNFQDDKNDPKLEKMRSKIPFIQICLVVFLFGFMYYAYDFMRSVSEFRELRKTHSDSVANTIVAQRHMKTKEDPKPSKD